LQPLSPLSLLQPFLLEHRSAEPPWGPNGLVLISCNRHPNVEVRAPGSSMSEELPLRCDEDRLRRLRTPATPNVTESTERSLRFSGDLKAKQHLNTQIKIKPIS